MSPPFDIQRIHHLTKSQGKGEQNIDALGKGRW